MLPVPSKYHSRERQPSISTATGSKPKKGVWKICFRIKEEPESIVSEWGILAYFCKGFGDDEEFIKQLKEPSELEDFNCDHDSNKVSPFVLISIKSKTKVKI